jgi:hypothetical protein
MQTTLQESSLFVRCLSSGFLRFFWDSLFLHAEGAGAFRPLNSRLQIAGFSRGHFSLQRMWTIILRNIMPAPKGGPLICLFQGPEGPCSLRQQEKSASSNGFL